MFWGKSKERNIVEQWRDKRLAAIPARDYESRVDMLHTVGFLNLFLMGKDMINTNEYGVLKPQVIVANILWGMNNGGIVFYWKNDLSENGKRFGIHDAGGHIVVRGDQVLTDIELKKNKPGGENCELIRECGIAIYERWRKI